MAPRSRASLKPESAASTRKRAAESPEAVAPSSKRSKPSSTRPPSVRQSSRTKNLAVEVEIDVPEASGSKAAKGSKRAPARQIAKPRGKALEPIKEDVAPVNGKKPVAAARKVAPKLGYLPLPKAFDKIRPARSAIVFGTGDSGEFGLGDDERGEKSKPELHEFFEEAIESGKFGEKGAGIQDLVCGGMHSLMIDEKGRVWSWGVNDGGALGRVTDKVPDPANPGQTLDRDVLEATPAYIQSLVNEGFEAVRVVAGDSVSMAISAEGKVKYWGSFRGKDGLMGFGGVDKKIQFEPVDLELDSGRHSDRFIAIAAGTDHIIALSADGIVYALGDGEKAQLGRKVISRRRLNALHPENVGLKKIVGIGAGAFHSFAINENGEVYGWGNNLFGQLGVADEDINPSWEKGVVERPTLIRALSPTKHDGAKVKLISAGENHSVFLFDNGALFSCGKIVNFEIGVASDNPIMTDEVKENQFIGEPTQVFFPPPSTSDNKRPVVPQFEDTEEYRAASCRVAHVDAGPRHNIAITTDGFYYSWGSGPTAQLGLGQEELSQVPKLIANKTLKTHIGLKAATGAGTSFILVQLRDEEWV